MFIAVADDEMDPFYPFYFFRFRLGMATGHYNPCVGIGTNRPAIDVEPSIDRPFPIHLAGRSEIEVSGRRRKVPDRSPNHSY